MVAEYGNLTVTHHVKLSNHVGGGDHMSSRRLERVLVCKRYSVGVINAANHRSLILEAQ